MDEKGLESLVKEYADLAKENKNIDVASLMANALAQQDQNILSNKTKRWVYLIALFAPPFGYLVSFWLLSKEEQDAKKVSMYCAILTTALLIGTFLFFKLFLSSAGVNLQQVQQINPQDVIELTK